MRGLPRCPLQRLPALATRGHSRSHADPHWKWPWAEPSGGPASGSARTGRPGPLRRPPCPPLPSPLLFKMLLKMSPGKLCTFSPRPGWVPPLGLAARESGIHRLLGGASLAQLLSSDLSEQAPGQQQDEASRSSSLAAPQCSVPGLCLWPPTHPHVCRVLSADGYRGRGQSKAAERPRPGPPAGPYHLAVVAADGLSRPAGPALVPELSPLWVLGVAAGHFLEGHEAPGEGVGHQAAPVHPAVLPQNHQQGGTEPARFTRVGTQACRSWGPSSVRLRVSRRL